MRAVVAALCVATLACSRGPEPTGDLVHDLQIRAMTEDDGRPIHWGPDPSRFVSWHHHSNRLVPVYTYGTKGQGSGVDLDSYAGPRSVYRDAESLRRLYGRLPQASRHSEADYLDQTDLARLQLAAIAAGKRHVFLVVFDGMGWEITRAAAIYRSGRVDAGSGRGSGLRFLDSDAAGTSQFAWMVTSPSDDRLRGDVDRQQVHDVGTGLYGGYDRQRGGPTPWTAGSDPDYVIAENFGDSVRHAITDSAAAATALCAGRKTFNGAINVDPQGNWLRTAAHAMQDRGAAVGIVTNVPISHATPAGAYAHNVSRSDYQDLTRDLLGLPSISHARSPLPGVDVLIGAGWGVERSSDRGQGANFVPGNRFLTDADRERIGGRYVVASRTPGRAGSEGLADASRQAIESGRRLLGFYGTAHQHLPYRTADGDYRPAPDRTGEPERYSSEELTENPTLAEMTAAALAVLEPNPFGFWMMLEAGDVDWAAHDANLDNVIGAVVAGDEAVGVIFDWVETRSDWNESLVIVTADHAHYLVVTQPDALAGSHESVPRSASLDPRDGICENPRVATAAPAGAAGAGRAP